MKKIIVFGVMIVLALSLAKVSSVDAGSYNDNIELDDGGDGSPTGGQSTGLVDEIYPPDWLTLNPPK